MLVGKARLELGLNPTTALYRFKNLSKRVRMNDRPYPSVGHQHPVTRAEASCVNQNTPFACSR